jgi:hypothetical protein
MTIGEWLSNIGLANPFVFSFAHTQTHICTHTLTHTHSVTNHALVADPIAVITSACASVTHASRAPSIHSSSPASDFSCSEATKRFLLCRDSEFDDRSS